MAALSDWYPDPLNSNDLRFFDGEGWTQQVMKNGVVTTDALDVAGLAAPSDLAKLPPPPTQPELSGHEASSNYLTALPPPPSAIAVIDFAAQEAEREARRAEREASLALKKHEKELKRAAEAEAKEQRRAEKASAKEVERRKSADLEARKESAKEENDRRKAELRKYKRASSHFQGVTLTPDHIRHHGNRHPLPGVRATVETAGQINQRTTLTRYLALGPLAGIAFKKSDDQRELYLTVEGDGFAFVVNVDPDNGLIARQFAAQINSAGMKAASTITSPPDLNNPDSARQSDEVNPSMPNAEDQDDFVAKLERLHKLHESGALNNEQYELAKERLLSDED